MIRHHSRLVSFILGVRSTEDFSLPSNVDAVAFGDPYPDEAPLDVPLISDAGWHYLPKLVACKTPRQGLGPLLTLLCAKETPFLLHMGLRLLGEDKLWQLINRSAASNVSLAGRRLTVWSAADDLDKQTITEQQADVYGFRRRCRNMTRDTWILDVGSNVGIATLHLLSRAPLARVIVVEPSPWSFFLLLVNLSENAPGRRIFAFRNAVSSLTKSSTFVSAHTSTMTSDMALAELQVSVVGVPTFAVQSTSLKYLIDLAGADSIALAKIDCEGCELDIGLELFFGSRIRSMVGELHLPCLHRLGEPGVEMRTCFALVAPYLSLSEKAHALNVLCGVYRLDAFKCSLLAYTKYWDT